jgi:hypothetical protein
MSLLVALLVSLSFCTIASIIYKIIQKVK